ncbi:substrate-binding domain-containing protein [Chryseoglobus sp. KN1116]|uniref:Substrate-binding domain-containing protein n=2 Tax=Microcella pacifica TaxID=2591847 RepID=A0A9E5JL71_9MICO|nr:substrate-binding domain-containing protein [Microcella pacifica]
MSMTMTSKRTAFGAVSAAAVSALILAGCTSTNVSEGSDGGEGDERSNLTADIASGTFGTTDQFGSIEDFCPEGAEEMTLGVVDGGGLNSWSKTVLAEIESEAARCDAITSVEYVAGRFDLEATTSGITSLAAKGTDIILVVPTAGPGEAHLPAMRQAVSAGSYVVAIASDPQGAAGTDFLDYADWSTEFVGESWGGWAVDVLGDEGGNVVFLGGPAGNLVSTQQFTGVQTALSSAPQVTLLNDEPIATNWDPAEAQQVMAGLLGQGEQIDAIIIDYGAVAAGVIRAYEAAGISVPPIATTDDNSLSCGFETLKADNPTYELATVSSRTWVGRIGLRKAVAAFQGLSNSEASFIELPIFEDSAGIVDGALAPNEACLPDSPPDATPSTLLTADEIAALFS